MSDRRIEDGGLYICLWAQDEWSKTDDGMFQFALYFHINSTNGGTEYKVEGQPGALTARHVGVRSHIHKSITVVGLLKIAQVPSSLQDIMDQQLRSQDNALNTTPNRTAKDWIFSILQVLQQQVQGTSILRQRSLVDLEAELIAFGQLHISAAEKNKQPRPITVSSKRFLDRKLSGIS